MGVALYAETRVFDSASHRIPPVAWHSMRSHRVSSREGPRALYRAMGSLAFTAAARIAWLVAKDNDDEQRRLLLPLKSNLIEDPTGLAFRLIEGVVTWDPDPVNVDADTVLASDGTDRSERAAAAEWLIELLAVGPMPVQDIRAAAEAEGHAWRTVTRAKKSLGVVSQREGFGGGGRFTCPSRQTGSTDRTPVEHA